MEIKATYVTFEQAKLIKEKGGLIGFFSAAYSSDGTYLEYQHYGPTLIIQGEFGKLLNPDVIPSGKQIYAPEQWKVVEWAFQKYKYSIEAEMNIPESGEYDGCYVFNGVIKDSEDYKLKIFYKSKDYPTREKAYSAAFDYVLKKLI